MCQAIALFLPLRCSSQDLWWCYQWIMNPFFRHAMVSLMIIIWLRWKNMGIRWINDWFCNVAWFMDGLLINDQLIEPQNSPFEVKTVSSEEKLEMRPWKYILLGVFSDFTAPEWTSIRHGRAVECESSFDISMLLFKSMDPYVASYCRWKSPSQI